MTRALLFLALALAGCTYATAPAPYCIVLRGPPLMPGGPDVIACECSSGARIPDVCGGGIAPTDSTYRPEGAK
ncbi:MAG TPA: hypothetical protein VFI41_12805 [Gemmatimonadales bacterium]|nr:hypothetical protein [Gemmatimonadales bacterium]